MLLINTVFYGPNCLTQLTFVICVTGFTIIPFIWGENCGYQNNTAMIMSYFSINNVRQITKNTILDTLDVSIDSYVQGVFPSISRDLKFVSYIELYFRKTQHEPGFNLVLLSI
jgi:hypothetical protein